MNILPKKRWHVRTKDNIARVRRDEAEAIKKDHERLDKLKFAESEARINFLRRQRGLPERTNRKTSTDNTSTKTLNETSSSSASSQHFDLFSDYKAHVKTTNKDLEREQKEEREKYEKQIGYLTYLGQDTNEALKLRSWYESAPKRENVTHNNDTEKTEKDLKNKYALDPLTLINSLLPANKKTKVSKEGVKVAETHNNNEEFAKPAEQNRHKKEKRARRKGTKKDKHHKRDTEKRRKNRRHKNGRSAENDLEAAERKRRDLLDSLRTERLQREAAERERQNAILKLPETKLLSEEPKTNTIPRIVQKYNSQFNPELAKQNML